MKGLQWNLLAGIILTVIIVLVGMMLIQPVAGFDVKKYFGLQPILGEPTGPSLPDIDTPPPGEDLGEVDHIITLPGEENQPHELGCVIANSIYDDFSANGLTGSRSNCKEQKLFTDNPVTQCLVDVKKFTLGDSKIQSDWETTLSAKKCHLCNESANTPITDFDEVCINKNLKDRTVGNSNFCNGLITAGKDLTTFGNAICARFNSGNWQSQCDGCYCTLSLCCIAGFPCANSHCNWGNDTNDFCDNNEDRVAWIADNADDGGRISPDPPHFCKGFFWYR